MKIFDGHFHIIDHRFPLVRNRGFLPDEFTCAAYRERAEQIGITGGAIVSGSFQAFDQTYLTDAMDRLGPTFVGVTQLPSDVSDEELVRLQGAGVRAVRFNLRRGGSAGIDDLESFARRVHERVDWHVEVYADTEDLEELYRTLIDLPRVVIDHLGLSRAAFPTLVKLVDHGVYVKASGFGRLDFDPGPVLRELSSINPNALIFGTDLPSTRAPRPFRSEDIHLVIETLGRETAKNVLYNNAVALYRPDTEAS